VRFFVSGELGGVLVTFLEFINKFKFILLRSIYIGSGRLTLGNSQVATKGSAKLQVDWFFIWKLNWYRPRHKSH
jgi:hypothetical protein